MSLVALSLVSKTLTKTRPSFGWPYNITASSGAINKHGRTARSSSPLTSIIRFSLSSSIEEIADSMVSHNQRQRRASFRAGSLP